MNTKTERYCPVTESLEESLKEMKAIREGKIPKKTWDDLLKESYDTKENNEVLNIIKKSNKRHEKMMRKLAD